MAKYRYEFVKQQIDGLKYIGTYVKLKRVGMVFRGICPFHNEKTPSFTVYPKGYMSSEGEAQRHTSFYCFGCGAGGDVIEFKKLKEGLESRSDACEALENEFGLTSNNEEAQQSFLQEQLKFIQNSQGNVLTLAEINLICSSICRNYLSWVKDYYLNHYEDEIKIIDKYYRYFDSTLLERNAVEAMTLIDEVNDKIIKRRALLKEGKEVGKN